MHLIIDVILLGASVLLLVPVSMFSIEVVASLFSRHLNVEPSARGRVTVLMPAHNESAVIRDTVRCLKSQLRPGDQVLVVADNCSDDTASIARAEGVDVVERFDKELRGKGYALDYGVRELSRNPPQYVVVLDADCKFNDDAIEQLLAAVAVSGRPAQSHYVMRRIDGSDIVSPIVQFAWLVRSKLRPLGLRALGGPCHLFGTGMAFSWQHLHDLPLATGNIAEDMQMGIDLARAGSPPRFCPEAIVNSSFAVSKEGAQTQRTRWEHGGLQMMLTEAPVMIVQSLKRLDPNLFCMALDMMIPPLALLAMLLLSISSIVAVLSLWIGPMVAAPVVIAELCIFFGTLFVAWIRCGKDLLALRDIPSLVLYPLRKLPIYFRFMFNRQKAWVRTKRTSD